MCIDFADAAKVYSDRTVIARKHHKCAECGREIAKGEQYRYAFMVYDHIPSTFATCVHCRVGQEWLLRTCNGFMHAGLAEEMREHAEEFSHQKDLVIGLLRVMVGIGRRWRRFDNAGLMPVPRRIADVSEEMLAS